MKVVIEIDDTAYFKVVEERRSWTFPSTSKEAICFSLEEVFGLGSVISIEVEKRVQISNSILGEK